MGSEAVRPGDLANAAQTTYDLLLAHPFLEKMPRPQLERLASWAHRALFQTGARIFSEGGRAERFWLIRDGSVALDLYIPGRGDVPIETLRPGAVLGWSWLYPPYQWHLGATATTQTLTVEFDAVAVRRLCAEDPVLGFDLYRRLLPVVIDRLQATRLRLLDLYRE